MSKVIGASGGGWKPPTFMHFNMVKDALKKYPEIDEFIIYIGGKMRDDISQADSLIIWDIYKKYLPLKVKLEVSNGPIGSIYHLADANKEDKIYWIIGSRNEADEKDIEQRAHSLSKHNNITLIKWVGDEKISGTKARAALKQSKEEFFKYLPKEITDVEREEIYSLLAPPPDEYKSDPEEIKEWVKFLGLDLKEELEEVLGEAKQVGNLYHFTSLDNLKDILKQNELSNSRRGARDQIHYAVRKKMSLGSSKDTFDKTTERSISTTRDKFLYKKKPMISGRDSRICLDGNKMSSKFKIEPHRYFTEPKNKSPEFDESEEIVITNKIENLDNYVISYDILLEDALSTKAEEAGIGNLFNLEKIQDMNNSKVRYLYKEKEVPDLEQWLAEMGFISIDKKETVSEEVIEEYHNKDVLNPIIWEEDKLKDDLRNSLLKIGNNFYESLDTDVPLQDIVLVGSSANYNWTEASDIDLHLLIDFNKTKDTELLKKFFNAKKREFNEKYELEYEGHPIEVYVQDIKEPNAAMGVYSIKDNKWLKIPEKEDIEVSDAEIDEKAQPLMDVIDKVEANPKSTPEIINKVKQKISQFRKSGLEKGGEYSVENLAFKKLRNNGYLEKLNDLETEKVKDSFQLNESPDDWYGTNNYSGGFNPAEFFDKKYGTQLSNSYKGEEYIDTDTLRDFIHKGEYRNEINNLYDKIIQLNPDLRRIKVNNDKDKFDLLYGVQSRLNIDDIDYYINQRNKLTDKGIDNWVRDNKMINDIQWVLSPQSFEVVKKLPLMEDLIEAKQVGDVYHFTSLDNLIRIGGNNSLNASEPTSKYPYISTTRNKNFSLERRKKGEDSYISSDQVIMKLDGNKLSNTYKVKPHDDQWDLQHSKEYMSNPQYGDEMEETWYGDKIKKDGGIKNIKYYIKEIILTPALDEYVDFLSRTKHFNGSGDGFCFNSR